MTGSLIYSALSDCLIVFCTAGFSSKWTFCSTDFVLLAGFVLYVRRVDDCRNMAADGAALAEVRAGITFGVELYVPWDAPEAVVDISSDGRPMAGFPVLGPLEHSVLEVTLDGGHSEMTIDEEPLARSVLDVALDGRPMEGIPVLEPLEHSVLVGALYSGLMEGMSHLEPLEHSVLNAA